MKAIGWLRVSSEDADAVLITVGLDDEREGDQETSACVQLVADGAIFELTREQARALSRFLVNATVRH